MSEELVSTGGAEMGTLGPLASRKTVAGAKLPERIQAGSSGRVSVGVQGAVGGLSGHCDGSSDSSAPEKQRGEGNSKKAMLQGMRSVTQRKGHLRAQAEKESMQGVRRGEHLPARSEKERVQGVRRGQHLPAQSD